MFTYIPRAAVRAQYMDSRKFTVRYEEEEGGGYSGQCLELPGAISQGENLGEGCKGKHEGCNISDFRIYQVRSRYA